MTAVQGQLYASQEGEEREDVRANQLDPAHLGLLYCHSVSCPVLGDDDCSGTCMHMQVTSVRQSGV